MNRIEIDGKPIGEMEDSELELTLYRREAVRNRDVARQAVAVLRYIDDHYGTITHHVYKAMLEQGVVGDGKHQKRDIYRLCYHLRRMGVIEREALGNYYHRIEQARLRKDAEAQAEREGLASPEGAEAEVDSFIERATAVVALWDASHRKRR